MNKRPLIGVIAAVCIVIAAATGLRGDWNSATTAAFLRVGIVMSALWLAYPNVCDRRIWQRFWQVAILVLVVTAVFVNRLRYLLPFILAALVIIWFIRPKRLR